MKERRCIFCNTPFNNKNQRAVVCKSKKHFIRCSKCGKSIEVNNFKELGLGKYSDFDSKIEIIKNEDSQCLFFIEEYLCKECKKELSKTDEYKEARRLKVEETYRRNHNGMSRAEFAKVNICQECGGRNGQHKRGCSNYKEKGVCEYCGYSLQSRKHARSCPLYKEPNVCEECGTSGGNHKKTCSKFKASVGACPYCGTPSGGFHKKDCPLFEESEKCEYCGNSLRSNRHKKDCPLYDAKKAKISLEKTRQTNLRRYGYTNIMKDKDFQKYVSRLAAQSENCKGKSNLNKQIRDSLMECGIQVSLEYFLDDIYYDMYCRNPKNGRTLLLEYNPTISHSSEHSYYWFICKDKPKEDNPISTNSHINRFHKALENNLDLITAFQDVDLDKLIMFVNKQLDNNVEISSENFRLKEIDKKLFDEFSLNNSLSKRHLSRNGDRYYSVVSPNGVVLCVMSLLKASKEKVNICLSENLLYNTEKARVFLFEKLREELADSSCTEIQLETENELGSYNFLLNCGFYVYREGKQRLLWANRDNIISDKELKKIGTKKYLSESNPRLYNNKESELTGDIEHDMHLFEYTKMYSCGFRIWKMNVQ